jgi:hypothetical protein
MDMQDDQVGQQPEDVAGLLRDHDTLLDVWVQQANQGLELGMTLMVGGLLVSGTLVGVRQYLQGIADEFRNAPGGTPGVGDTLAEAFDIAVADLYGPSEREASDDGDGDTSSEQDVGIGFLHMKDVRVFDPQGHSTKAAWWRGRLTAVDAFMFGTPS